MIPIYFQNSDIDFDLPIPEERVKQWIVDVIEAENHRLDELSYVFTSDESLLEINQSYLNHDTYTDIITFDYSDEANTINGEILISVDRVKENAENFEVEFVHELARVMIHGVIHLLGYNDKTANEKTIMREKENTCISLLKI
ncbi:MAG: rRNA maturation RNase YbeY [Cyclobacteriaceae bacterium]|nr:rRNA maturation RNase YbeY [Cyclobacteriaceae bacterium SS2]